MPEFYRKLQFQQKVVLLFLLMVFFFSLIGFFSICVLAGAGLNLLSPWQEQTAWGYMNAVMLLSGVVLIGGIYLIFRNRPDPIMLARMVEERHTELKENLSTAVEIIERGTPPNAIEQALLRQVECECEKIPFRTATLPKHFHPIAVLMIVVTSTFIFDYANDSQLAKKAWFYQMDKLSGEHTGLIIEPGDAEAPLGSDLVITAEVTRWEMDASIILNEGGTTVRYPMMLDESGVAQFTLFDLQGATSYRVETPSLRSAAYTVAVFSPPTLDAVDLQLAPPAYTRQEPLAFSKLLDLFPIEGTEITLGIETGAGVSASLRVGDKDMPFEGAVAFTVREDVDYQLTLVNDEGRQFVTESYAIDVTPDEPPVAEIVDPEEDTEADLSEIIPVELYSADDFGIAKVELHVSVSGLPRRPLEVFQADSGEPVLEKDFLSLLDIPRLSVEYGDVVSYYFKVTDNREPEPNVTQTSLFFIEVAPEGDDAEEEESGEGEGQGEQRQEVNLRAIIVELKRVIRETHASTTLSGEARSAAMQQLGADLNSIDIEARQVLSQIGGALMQVEGGEFFLIMNNALERITEAEAQLNADLPNESIPLQEEALSDMLKLEGYIRSQSQPSSSGQGAPSEQKNAQSQGDPEEGEGEGNDSEMSMAEMKELMESLNRMAEDQAMQNRRYERAARANLSEEEQAQLADAQEAIQSEAGQEAKGLQGKPGFGPLRREVSNAEGYMEDAAQAVTSGNTGQAANAGARSNEALLNAMGMLDEKIREAAAGAINELISQTDALAGKQAGAAEQSGEADAAGGKGASRKAMHGEQLGLNEEYAQLKAELERSAAELSEQFPEAGEQLSRASREADSAKTDASMTRAANALLYGRYGKAEELQTDATEGIESLAESLREARDKVTALSAGELQELLQMVSDAKEAQQSGKSPNAGERDGQEPGEDGQTPGESSAQQQGEGKPQPNSMGKLGTELQAAGQQLQNDSLSELGERMSAPEGNGGTTNAREDNIGMLDNAAAILQQYLRSQMVDERIRYKRQSAPPPDKYRQLVEQYFKDLAEEP